MRLPISLLPAFCLGIVLAFVLSQAPSLWLLGSVFLISVILSYYRPSFRHLCVFILGLSYSVFRIELALENRLPLTQNRQVQTLQIVVEDISVKEDYGTRFTARVLNRDSDIPEKITLTDYQKEEWPAGSLWRINTRLRTPVGSVNLAGFNSEAYSLSKGLGATGSVQKGRKYLGESKRPRALLDRLRNTIARRIHRTGESYPRGAALIAALTIGEQNSLTQADWQSFRQTGITHLVSISGLHVTMVALFAGWLARFLACRLRIRRIQPRTLMLFSGMAVAFIYALLAGFSVPTQRSIFMLASVALLMLSRRYFTSWQIWWISLSFVLLISPLAVLSLGFWLSFGLVAGLLWLGSNRRHLGRNRWLLALQAQVAATVSSIVPLSFFFGQLPVVSPLVNILAIPWVSWIITPLALIALCLPVDTPLLWACVLGEYSLRALDLLLPFAYEFVVAKPPLLLLGIGLLATLLLLAPRGFPMKGLGLLGILLVLLYQPDTLKSNEAKITVLDVGQGSSMLVQTREHSLLFDTGLGGANWIVLPNLRAQRIRQLDALVLSHNDADHDSGLAEIARAYPKTQIYAGQTDAYPDYPSIQYCQGGQQWVWDGVVFQWLTLEPFSKNNNDMSCVLKITAHNQTLLITGDLSRRGEKKLIAQHKAILNSNILILGHHGSKTSSSAEFLQAVQPMYVVASSGFANRFAHPDPSVLARVKQQGATVFRTDQQGAVQIQMRQTLSLSAQVIRKPFWQIKPLMQNEAEQITDEK